ncbi:MAG: phytoene synthase [Pelagibacterales bacterium MED-G40]|nr:MAG: phytoene synthase [Pelagibacterales bacterium MED-G40]|tara:strand:+ start:1031 stop:1879 length:849 start_codon:yes stop_codon:yes gene_type:complete
MKNNLLSKHAKSFNWAGFFLSKEIYKKCSFLYDFCRTLDDIADEETSLEVKRKNFLNFKSNFKNKDFSDSIIKNIWELLEKENISIKIAEDLFDGVESDLKDEVKINNKKELFIYSYRVAGTVGLMMSKILKVKDKDYLKGAIDLGIAMQLTNIARDVVEDKKRNRSYINHDFNSIKEIIEIADTFYESSFPAIKAVPLSSRFSIMVARRVYRKIGDNILNKKNLDNYNNAGKIYVSSIGKIIQTILSLYDLIRIYFVNYKEHLKKNEHLMINEQINLNERI